MNVLKCEFVKLRKSLAFKICLLIMILGSILMGQMVLSQNLSDQDFHYTGIIIGLNTFSDCAMVVIFGAIMAGMFICTDFENRTIQESIVCGNSYLNIILCKTFVYILSLIIIYLPYPIISGFMISRKYGWGIDVLGVSGVEAAGKLILVLISIFFAYMPVIVFFVLISFLVQKTGVSLAINISVMILGTNVLKMLLSRSELLNQIYEYSFFGLYNKPFSYLNLYQNDVLANVNLQNYLPIIICGTVWTFLIFTVAVIIFKKRDLK